MLRPLIHRCHKHMSWQMDGRDGVARVGDSQRKGFALMRDQCRHRIAFRALPNPAYAPANQAYAPCDPERVLLGRFEVEDDDFKPSVA